MSILSRLRGKVVTKPVTKGIGSLIFSDTSDSPQAWANRKYSEYVATSVPAYRAVTLRASAVSAARPVVGMVVESDGRKDFVPAGDDHPVQVMLDAVNDMYSRADLWYATECQLSLSGTSYWLLDDGQIWLLQPDRMTVIPTWDSRGLYAEVGRYEYDNEQGKTIRLTPKEERANPLASAAERGHVKLIRSEWNAPFLDELESFPIGLHDDQVDAASGAFAELAGTVPLDKAVRF